MVKAVLDTSVFVAALLSRSKTSVTVKLLERWRQGHYTLIMAPRLLVELADKLLEKGIAEQDVGEMITAIGRIALHIPGAYQATRLDRVDPDDNMLLAAAYEAQADYLITLDSKHVLPLKHYHGTQIVSPTRFLTVLDALKTDPASDLPESRFSP